MPRPKKQKTQPTIEASLAEDQSTSITVDSVKDTTLQVKPLLDGRAGYLVPCGMCGSEIWTSFIDPNLVFVCGPCADELPE